MNFWYIKHYNTRVGDAFVTNLYSYSMYIDYKLKN